MFDEAAVFHAEDVDRDHWLGCPAYITPMDHDDVAFCDDHSRLVAKSFRKRAQKAGDGVTSIGNRRIVLNVVRRE
jgi:hypothetical protein